MDTLFNIGTNIVCGIIAAFLFELLRSNSDWFPGPRPLPIPLPVSSPGPDKVRLANKQKLNLFVYNVFFYFYTLYLVYAALVLPATIRAWFSRETLLLSQARFIGEYLPSIPIESGPLQTWGIIAAIALYIPLWLLVNLLSGPIARVLDNFVEVNIYRWRAIQTIIFALLAAAVAIGSIYIFGNGTFKDAAMSFFFFMTIGAVFTFGRQR